MVLISSTLWSFYRPTCGPYIAHRVVLISSTLWSFVWSSLWSTMVLIVVLRLVCRVIRWWCPCGPVWSLVSRTEPRMVLRIVRRVVPMFILCGTSCGHHIVPYVVPGVVPSMVPSVVCLLVCRTPVTDGRPPALENRKRPFHGQRRPQTAPTPPRLPRPPQRDRLLLFVLCCPAVCVCMSVCAVG